MADNNNYNFGTDGAQSERAFIGAIAAALENFGDEQLTKLFDTVTDPAQILAEPGAIQLFKIYAAEFKKGSRHPHAPALAVDDAEQQRQIVNIIDNCISEQRKVNGEDFGATLEYYYNNYIETAKTALYSKLAERMQHGSASEVNEIKKRIEDLNDPEQSAAAKLKRQYSNINLLEYFSTHDPETQRRVISTGFKNLDYYFNGGLRDELYIINAGTSAGKSALTVQIADYIAETQPVILIELEMAQREIIARSLSRETFKYSLKHCGAGDKIGRTQYQIEDFGSYYYNEETGATGYTKDELNAIEQATAIYGKMAPNIYTVESIGQININDIKNYVTKFAAVYDEISKATGKAIYPVVIIDYLQLIAPTQTGMDERRTADEIVTGLKQIARDFKASVICISAIGRAAYNQAATISGAKNSGGIEYTAGVVIGLQYFAQTFKVIGPKTEQGKDTGKPEFSTANFDDATERRRTPRVMELVILKNRAGIIADDEKRIILKYYAAYNYFEEITGDEHLTASERIDNERKKIQRDYADKYSAETGEYISDAKAFTGKDSAEQTKNAKKGSSRTAKSEDDSEDDADGYPDF